MGNTTGVTTVNRNMIWVNRVLLSWMAGLKKSRVRPDLDGEVKMDW